MTRCNACNGVIKKSDLECYTCGDAVPGTGGGFWRRKRESQPKPAAPLTPLSNLLFLASLVLMAVSFLSTQRMPLPVSLTISGILLIARMVADRRAAPRQQRVRTAPRSAEMPPALLR